MIDKLNVNHKVGTIVIGFSLNNKWNQYMIQLMKDRYHNVYKIEVVDDND